MKKGFKKSIFWNEYKSKIETHTSDESNFKRILLDSSFQGVNRLFVLGYSRQNPIATDVNSDAKYTLPGVDLTKCNVLIDGRNFYDQPISYKIKKHEELTRLRTGKGQDYATGCLLDYSCFKKHYTIIACDLSKQKELDADPRVIQQLEVTFMLGTNINNNGKSKETILEMYKGTTKVL